MWCVGGVGKNCSWKKGCSWTLVMSRLLFKAHVWTQLGDAVSVRSDAGDVTAPFQSTCVDAATQRHCSASQAENACIATNRGRWLDIE